MGDSVVIVYEAKMIKDLVPVDFIEYFQKLPDLYKWNIVDHDEGNNVIKYIWESQSPMKTAIYIQTLYAPQYNAETGELIYVDTTIGNRELEAKHISAEEMQHCVVAKRSECWIVSPVSDDSGHVIGCSLKRVYYFDYGSIVPSHIKKKFSQ